MEIQKFNPTKAEIQKAVSEVESLTITGIEDKAGYAAVKSGKNKLAAYRIEITKFGKGQREEALAWQREVLKQEKELLGMIEPTETKLKGQLETIDEEKKSQERLVLLPARIKMLEEVGVKLLDAEILQMDEISFSAYYTEKKMQYLEMQETKRKQEEEANRRTEEMEIAKKEAIEMARKEEQEKAELAKAEAEKKAKEELERVEREKLEAIEKIKKEQEEKERKAKEAEAERVRKEKEEQEKAEKNRKYKTWLEKHGIDPVNKDGIHLIQREGNTFTLYKKIDSITI